MNKKAQHETVGFVIIVIIVIVAGMFFLIMMASKPDTIDGTNSEIGNFLEASGSYTTDCAVGDVTKIRKLEDLALDCYNGNKNCMDGRKSCDVLNQTYVDLLSRFKPAGTLNYYSMSFYYSDNASSSLLGTRVIKDIVYSSSSGCIVKRSGKKDILVGKGRLRLILETCSPK